MRVPGLYDLRIFVVYDIRESHLRNFVGVYSHQGPRTNGFSAGKKTGSSK